jgi:hypothetical protein
LAISATLQTLGKVQHTVRHSILDGLFTNGGAAITLIGIE